eukprot:m.87356 g.87356  ORF g.87356 m.87356 type:complete len:378 (+) comp12239_c0_seq2:181-1314(+)
MSLLIEKALLLLVALQAFFPSVDAVYMIMVMVVLYMVATTFLSQKKFLPFFYSSLLVWLMQSIALLLLFHNVIEEDSIVVRNFMLLAPTREVVLLAFVVTSIVFRIESYIKWDRQTRRKMIISTWRSPSEASILGMLDIRAEKLVDFLKKQSEKDEVKITVTHAAIKAIGMVLKASPSVNGHIMFGRFYPSKTADIGCLVTMPSSKGSDLGNAKIKNADSSPLASISTKLEKLANNLRKGRDSEHESRKLLLRLLPTFLLQPMLVVAAWIASAGISIPALGVSAHPMGTCLVTSVGMLGLDFAFPPFTPFANTPVLMMIGRMSRKPVVDQETGEVSSALMLPIFFNVDHRYVDGAEGAAMAKRFKDILENPHLLVEA